MYYYEKIAGENLNGKLFDLIVYLAENSTEPVKPTDQQLLKQFEDKGFTDSEINYAITWFNKHIKGGAKQRKRFSVRVLSREEKQLFTPEAQGYILRLLELGVITREQFELIVARAEMGENERIDLETLKTIVSYMVLEGSYPDEFDGFPPFHRKNDTVN
ncbi:DUF494 family protein [bacterium]|nr:DUF494 family protein [bacterium]